MKAQFGSICHYTRVTIGSILLKPSMICSRVYQNSIIKVDLIKDEKYLESGKIGIPLDLGLIHYSSVSTILG